MKRISWIFMCFVVFVACSVYPDKFYDSDGGIIGTDFEYIYNKDSNDFDTVENGYVDGDTDSDADTDTDIDVDTDTDSDIDTDADADTDTDADADTDADSDTDADADSDTDMKVDYTCKNECLNHCNSLGGIIINGTCPEGLKCCDMNYTDADIDSDADADTDSDSDVDADTDTDTDTDIDTDSDTDTDTDTDTDNLIDSDNETEISVCINNGYEFPEETGICWYYRPGLDWEKSDCLSVCYSLGLDYSVETENIIKADPENCISIVQGLGLEGETGYWYAKIDSCGIGDHTWNVGAAGCTYHHDPNEMILHKITVVVCNSGSISSAYRSGDPRLCSCK